MLDKGILVIMRKEGEQTNIGFFPNSSKRQLFLLHFAGGSAHSFDFLKRHISDDIDFCPLELPGRGARFGEVALRSKNQVIEDYLRQIKVLRNSNPYVIYGHSMGATLGLSVAKRMEESGDPPGYLIVSGNPGPGIKEVSNKKRYQMNDTEFKEELRVLGGVPEEVLSEEELYRVFSPILRADFEVLEKENHLEEDLQLHLPIFALMGTKEESNNRIWNWKRFTTSYFRCEVLKGHHFFIYDHPKAMARIIDSCFYVNSLNSRNV